MDAKHRFTGKVAFVTGAGSKAALRSSVVISAATVIAVAIVGCSAGPGGTADGTPSSGSSSPAGDLGAGSSTPVVFELDGEEIAGELDGSPASVSLIAQLPLTMTFRDYGGQEIIGALPLPLDLEDAPDGSAAPALTIGYYVPQQSLVLYYESVGYFGGIVPIGTFENSGAVEGRSGELTITIRVR